MELIQWFMVAIGWIAFPVCALAIAAATLVVFSSDLRKSTSIKPQPKLTHR